MKTLYIIKTGGNVIDDPVFLDRFLSDFASIRENKILVHGGGKIATEIAKSLGIEAIMVDGRRITDKKMLDLVTMVYGGLINKNIVAKLQSYGCNAIGLTGADGNIMPAVKRNPVPVDFGFVGDVESAKFNVHSLKLLIEGNMIPVIAPLTHDEKGNMLNTNADTIASSLAVALSKVVETKLIYCFEKRGVLASVDDDHSVIPEITFAKYQELKKQGVISKGMIPKMDNSFDAIKAGVKAVVICSAENILVALSGKQINGTLLHS